MARRASKADFPWRTAAVYAATVVVLAGFVAAWQVRYEQARRPPPPDVVARRLVEGVVGEGTVQEARVAGEAAEVWVVLDGVKGVPQDRRRWRPFLRDLTDILADRLFQVLPLLTREPVELQTVRVRYQLKGREVAVGERRKTQRQATVTMVGP